MKHPISLATAIPMLAHLSHAALLPRQSSNTSTAPTLSPFLQFQATLSPQTYTTDISSHFGLFQYGGNGSFTGNISGTVPETGTLEIIYPGPYPPARNGVSHTLTSAAAPLTDQYAITTLILNTTSGVPLMLKAQGAVELGVDNSPAVRVIGGASLQTLNEEYEYLNEKYFVFELCGGTGRTGNQGQARLWEIESSLECMAQA